MFHLYLTPEFFLPFSNHLLQTLTLYLTHMHTLQLKLHPSEAILCNHRFYYPSFPEGFHTVSFRFRSYSTHAHTCMRNAIDS